jgi:hypothetical protein
MLDAQVDDHNPSICTDMCGGAREYYSLFAVHAKAVAHRDRRLAQR